MDLVSDWRRILGGRGALKSAKHTRGEEERTVGPLAEECLFLVSKYGGRESAGDLTHQPDDL